MTKQELEQWEQYKEELGKKNEKFFKDSMVRIREERAKLKEERERAGSRVEMWICSIREGKLAEDTDTLFNSIQKPTIEGFYDWLSENKR